LVLFGSSLFYLYGFRAGVADGLTRRWGWPHLALLIAAVAGLVGVMVWVMAQTALITEDAGDAFHPAAIFSILTETRFGRICLLRMGLLGASIVILWRLFPGRALWIAQAVIGGTVLASLAWTGHGATDEGWTGALHLGGDVLHLVTAGVWIGALVPLSILILLSLRSQTTGDALATYKGLESFSGIGPAVVAILVLTGAVNSWFLIGIEQWHVLFTSTYGLALVFKLALFGLMLLLAVANRFRLTPRLRTAIQKNEASNTPLQSLKRSVLAETCLALLVMLAVSWLGTLEPPVSSG
jgi:putative copper resistance protein D